MTLQGHLSVLANHLIGQEGRAHYFFWGVYVRCAFGEHSPTSPALLARPEVLAKEQICHRAAKSDITRTNAVPPRLDLNTYIDKARHGGAKCEI